MRRQAAFVAMLAVAACTATGSAFVPPIASLAPADGVSRETLLALTSLCSAEASEGARPNPDLKLAGGMGVEAARATTLETCADLMRQSFGRPGPFLIELLL